MATAPFDTRDALVVRGRRLEYIALGWNFLEALLSIVAGLLAGSVALVGFGFDSVIEVSSGAILLWRLRTEADVEHRERIAIRLVGGCFLALAAYVAWDAISSLLHREAPRESYIGIAVAAASLIAMPLLARAKRRVARGLNSGALHADSRQTDICAYLSAILLGGLLLNAVLGWWWADPLAAIIMVPLIAKEGVEGVRGRTCCDSCHT